MNSWNFRMIARVECDVAPLNNKTSKGRVDRTFPVGNLEVACQMSYLSASYAWEQGRWIALGEVAYLVRTLLLP